MKKFFAFIVTGVLALGLCAPIVSHETALTARAATGTGYTSADDVEYVKSGKYIANWGARDEDCVFLSSYAESFYTGNYTFDVLSELSGGTSQANAPQSALYGELQDLMTSKQTYQTSYDATRDKFCYTDCVKSNFSNISSFYSGEVLSGTWDSGKTWNREHTWPNSKGDASGNGENDIMMLRPTSVKENSSRGNKAYGESGNYYDPNQHGQNVRGDCARIVLFVYTRWGNTKSMWGSSGVMENLNVLLRWMEEDPVDTWEMGRNDAVQSITGTRNVFVDYPEYAWLLFGKEVPENMSTPSGEANGGVVTPPSSGGDDTTTGGGTEGNGEDECEHVYERWHTILRPTLTAEGKKTAFCEKCGHEETETIPMLTEEADTGSDADSNVEETEGCAATVGCISLGCMALLAVGLYVRKRRENE